MKRRDFITTTVGAGLLVSAYPKALFARFQSQGRRGTLFDKIWDAHVVANLGGETDLLQVDRCIGGSPTQVMRFVRDGVELRNPEIFYSVPDHTVSTSPDRYDDPSLGWGWQPYEELAGEMRELGFTKAFGQTRCSSGRVSRAASATCARRRPSSRDVGSPRPSALELEPQLHRPAGTGHEHHAGEHDHRGRLGHRRQRRRRAHLPVEGVRSMGQDIQRGGHAFDVHEGLAAPFMFDNVSTDVIAPALTNLTDGLDAPRGGLGSSRGATAFANIRYNADGSPRRDFVFNQEAYRTASIMVVGKNYATGSSRVTGVTRPLTAWGVRVYIGESFGPIFLTNAVQYGVLTIELPRETLNEIVEWVESHHGVRMQVDLERQLIELRGRDPIPFETDPRVRSKLLNGLHDLEEIEPHLPAARAMRERDEQERPWIYRSGDPQR